MKVLIVDDEIDICRYLQRELKKEGFEVEYSTSPAGVIDMLYNARREGKPYDLLFLDIRMPEIDGFKLLREIREAPLDLDVIIITGYGDEDKAIEAIRLGAVDYLPKPISLDDLHVAIFRVQQKKAKEAKETLRYNILVVDDEKDLCDRIKRELEREGYQTAVAYDGDEGLNYFKDNKVDIVITDIRMPRMSGLEMLENCRKITDDFVSIIITGHGDHETAIEALRLGVLNYLRKPISLEELFVSVDKGVEMLLLRRGLSAHRRELEIETALKKQYAKNLEEMVEEKTEALRESEERYRAIVDNTVLGITIMDTNYKIIMTNTTFAELFRKSPSDFVGKYCFREYEHRETVCPHCPGTRAMASGNTAEVETYTVLDDGSRVDVRNRAIPLFSRDGSLKGFIEVVENITERKRAEESLQESEEKLRTITTSAQDAIIMIDNEANISFWNEADEKMFGYLPQEALGKELHILAPHRYYEAYIKGIKNFKMTGQVPVFGKTLELEGLKKDGTEFPIELSVSAVKIKGKWSAIGILRDITERKRAEEALLKSEEELKKRVKELEEFYQMAVGRELKMIELKEEIEGLKEELEKYKNKLET